jgi:hypothetical protein
MNLPNLVEQTTPQQFPIVAAVAGFPVPMHHRQYQNAIRLNRVKHRIRKHFD